MFHKSDPNYNTFFFFSISFSVNKPLKPMPNTLKDLFSILSPLIDFNLIADLILEELHG